jgi:aspartyl-tRNA(Asn)/glutamyl-tRNA(Gln) amidotransferase subunit A
MTAIDVENLSIAQAARALRDRAYSPLELTDAYLRRIEQLNPTVNAFITVTAERAREDAQRATDEFAAGRVRGPLHGIPIAHKDLYETAGIRTTGGSKIHANHIPKDDCTVARKLREAGTVLLGKLNTHEYAYGVTTNNPHYGATRNPWDLDRIPAGSSGGSGAAIAAGMATAATGSDTGGSIRMPASVCGVVGLKPTYGRVSKAGVLPLSWRFDHTGPLTRTVEDAALVMNVIAGYDPFDPASVRLPVADAAADLGAGVRGLRIGVPRGYFFDHLEDDIATAMERAIEVLVQLGADVRAVDVPGIAEGLGGTFGFVLAEAQDIHAAALRDRPEDFGLDVLEILLGYFPSAAELMAGQRAVNALTVAMRTTLETVDVLLTPTTPITAPLIGQDQVRYGSIEESVLGAMIRCTAPFNATHLPALSVPCGFNHGGLPIGLQIAGRPFDEATVLRVGHAYEQATSWHLRTPVFPDSRPTGANGSRR